MALRPPSTIFPPASGWDGAALGYVEPQDGALAPPFNLQEPLRLHDWEILAKPKPIPQPTRHCVICDSTKQIERCKLDLSKGEESKNRIYVCHGCHRLIHRAIKQYGENPLVKCDICGRATLVLEERFTFKMCNNCYFRERELRLQSESFAELRLEIANELGKDYMATQIDQKFVDEHVYFYNDEAAIVHIDNMNFAQLEEHINELEKIFREVKTRLSKSKEEKRERIAKLSKEERDRLLSPNTNPADSSLVTNSIATVKRRQERMNIAQKAEQAVNDLCSTALERGTMTQEQVDAYKKSLFADLRVSTDKPATELRDKRPITPVSFIHEPLHPKSTIDTDTMGEAQTSLPAENSVKNTHSEDSQLETKTEEKEKIEKKTSWLDTSSIKFSN